MKLLMTADTVGGVWTYALDLTRALAERGVHTVLATMGAAPTPEQREEAARVPGLTLCESRYKLEWMDDPWEDVARAGEWLLALEQEHRPDLVHLNGYAHGALPWRAPVLMAGHSCVLSWWEAVKGEPAPAAWDRYREAVARGLRAADLVVAPTGAMLASLERHYGPLRATRVILNGRDPTPFAPLAKEPVVLAAGRVWDEAKNVAALAAVAPRLPWPVQVAGEERHPDGGAARLENVHPLGRLPGPALAERFGRAALYALPARYEPFGLSPVEAAFSGCALVLGDLPSLREVWGDAATYVPPHDPEALHRALVTLIQDPARREEMASRARARAARYTPARMAEEYLQAYRALVAAHGGRGEDRLEETPPCAS